MAPLRRKIEAKLRQMRWSPEQISGWLCEQGIKLSHERIYQMIWQDKRDGGDLWRSLRRRGKRYNKRGGKNAGRGLIPDKIDISERPTIVARKARLGDWEGDTVVSAGHKGGLLTLVERKTQLAKIIKLPRATAHATQRAAVRRLKPIGEEIANLTSCKIAPPAQEQRPSSASLGLKFHSADFDQLKRKLQPFLVITKPTLLALSQLVPLA